MDGPGLGLGKLEVRGGADVRNGSAEGCLVKAFKRVSLKAGQTAKVSMEIALDDLRYWDVEASQWTLEHGTLELLLGSASDDIREKAEIKI